MENLMASLHPAIPPGPFDLDVLLGFSPPVNWRWTKEGQSVTGLVLKITESERDGYSFPVVELMDEHARLIRVRCSAVMLRNQIEDLHIKPGSVISITFDGTKMGQSGREYRKFTVRN